MRARAHACIGSGSSWLFVQKSATDWCNIVFLRRRPLCAGVQRWGRQVERGRGSPPSHETCCRRRILCACHFVHLCLQHCSSTGRGLLSGAAMSKGGARKHAVAECSQTDFTDVVLNHVKAHGLVKGPYFHHYELIDRTNAAVATGLAANFSYLSKLLELMPSAEFKPTVVSKGWLLAAKHHPGLNSTHLPHELWSGASLQMMLCQTRCNCFLLHVTTICSTRPQERHHLHNDGPPKTSQA
jgi:hypothetical protein